MSEPTEEEQRLALRIISLNDLDMSDEQCCEAQDLGLNLAHEVMRDWDFDRMNCNVCGEAITALIHTDTKLHADDAADGLTLHKFEPIVPIEN